jgi:hypothetical protein
MSRNLPSEPSAARTAILAALRAQIRRDAEIVPSGDGVLGFVKNVLRCPNAGPLAGLAIRAAFQVIGDRSGRVTRFVVGAGDSGWSVERDDSDRGTTVYCHPRGPVTRAMIEGWAAAGSAGESEHVIVVTTDPIDPAVAEYAAGRYQHTGIEFAILDCVGFLRHFLHLFHRHRAAFLDAYQALVLAEPDSAVGFELKQAFLVLRQAATTSPTDA